MKTRVCSSLIPRSAPIVQPTLRPRAATAASKSAAAAPPAPIGLPSAIPTGRACASIAAIKARRIDKKTGAESLETRLYISSLAPDPALLLACVRAHWSIENNLHWVLDVAFDEDRCRTRKDNSARALALMRKAALNLLKREPTPLSIRRKRAKACMNPDFRAKILAA